MGLNIMQIKGDNPFDDGLDFVGCPPQPAKLKLPKIPENFRGESKLICWGRCMPFPDGERMMTVLIDDFEPDPRECGVYKGEVHFIDTVTGEEWYKGERLKFYYTRNYVHTGNSPYGKIQKSIAFRFVVKGDIERVYDKMPEWECLILCTKPSDKVNSYDNIFVYGGLDILFDVECEKMEGFILGLGHNDGWYTHHPKCSKRPIDWHGAGDYIGHYCDRGWLFVSPGRNFVFDPNINPPTGGFSEEALREIGEECYTEDAIRCGGFDLEHKRCIHSYQKLKGITECKTSFESTEFCQGLVYTNKRYPWITFFSMGYWIDRYQKQRQILHLVEGNIEVDNDKFEKKYGKELYYYGFSTQNYHEELKLVDLASNKDIIGEPVDTNLLLYLYNAGAFERNPKLRRLIPVDLKLPVKLLKEEIEATKDKEECPFFREGGN
jgi:hypothetical protein